MESLRAESYQSFEFWCCHASQRVPYLRAAFQGHQLFKVKAKWLPGPAMTNFMAIVANHDYVQWDPKHAHLEANKTIELNGTYFLESITSISSMLKIGIPRIQWGSSQGSLPVI